MISFWQVGFSTSSQWSHLLRHLYFNIYEKRHILSLATASSAGFPAHPVVGFPFKFTSCDLGPWEQPHSIPWWINDHHFPQFLVTNMGIFCHFWYQHADLDSPRNMMSSTHINMVFNNWAKLTTDFHRDLGPTAISNKKYCHWGRPSESVWIVLTLLWTWSLEVSGKVITYTAGSRNR